MRLSHLLCAALGAAAAYMVLTREQKGQVPQDLAAGDGDADAGYDVAAAAEAMERRRVRAGQAVQEPDSEGAAA